MIDAFCEYLSDGLFIVPTHTWGNVTADNAFYDVKKTEPCIGVLPKIAAFRKDGVRSLHPTHSIKVFGKRAEEFVKGEEKSKTPTPVGGAMSRLYDEDEKILLIGVGQERNTFIHAVDEMLDIKNRLTEGFSITIKDKNDKIYKVDNFKAHIRDTSKYYPKYVKAFEYHNALTYTKLGNAKVTCCYARKIKDVLELLWSRTDHDLSIDDEIIPEEYYIKGDSK